MHAHQVEEAGCVPAQGVVVTHPGHDRAPCPLFFSIAKCVDLVVCPGGLLGNGQLNVGDIGGLEQARAARRALFGDDEDCAKAEGRVGGGVFWSGGRGGRGEFGVDGNGAWLSWIEEEEKRKEGEGDDGGRPFPRGYYGDHECSNRTISSLQRVEGKGQDSQQVGTKKAEREGKKREGGGMDLLSFETVITNGPGGFRGALKGS